MRWHAYHCYASMHFQGHLRLMTKCNMIIEQNITLYQGYPL